MYDQLQENIPQKHFIQTNRQYPNTNINDLYALQPWEKNTLQVELKNDEITRQFKTFYKAPELKTQERHYRTHRGFSFRNPTQNKGVDRPKSLAEVSKKSAISHYNISGNILGEKMKNLNSLPFQLPPKRTKSLRSKQLPTTKGIEDLDQFHAYQSVIAMKKRLSLQKEKSLDGFFVLNHQESQKRREKFPLQRRQNKVISIGFQKFARFKHITKQRSLQINVNATQI